MSRVFVWVARGLQWFQVSQLKAFSSDVSEPFPRLNGIDDDGRIALILRMCEVGGADMACSTLLLSYMFPLGGASYNGLFPSNAATLALYTSLKSEWGMVAAMVLWLSLLFMFRDLASSASCNVRVR